VSDINTSKDKVATNTDCVFAADEENGSFFCLSITRYTYTYTHIKCLLPLTTTDLICPTSYLTAYEITLQHYMYSTQTISHGSRVH